jgi:hypothetical protein
MSQRENSFNGGIQAGTVATDRHAKHLDRGMKMIAEELAAELKEQGFTMCKRLNRKEALEEFGIEVGCEPDGGLWYKDGKLIAMFEGKKQGKGGNAIERWFKNNFLADVIDPDVKYVTLGSREGFAEGAYCYRIAKTVQNVKNRKINVLYDSGTSWMLNADGFTLDEIRAIMRETLVGEAH